MPFARATGMGSTLDCADHSNSVCFFVRSTISWPVMVGLAVAVVIYENLMFPSCTLVLTLVSLVVRQQACTTNDMKVHQGTQLLQNLRECSFAQRSTTIFFSV